MRCHTYIHTHTVNIHLERRYTYIHTYILVYTITTVFIAQYIHDKLTCISSSKYLSPRKYLWTTFLPSSAGLAGTLARTTHGPSVTHCTNLNRTLRKSLDGSVPGSGSCGSGQLMSDGIFIHPPPPFCPLVLRLGFGGFPEEAEFEVG